MTDRTAHSHCLAALICEGLERAVPPKRLIGQKKSLENVERSRLCQASCVHFELKNRTKESAPLLLFRQAATGVVEMSNLIEGIEIHPSFLCSSVSLREGTCFESTMDRSRSDDSFDTPRNGRHGDDSALPCHKATALTLNNSET